MIVADASVVAGAVLPSDRLPSWELLTITDEELVAPHVMPAEVTQVLRRTLLAGVISAETGARAHLEVVTLPTLLVPYAPYAERVWQLRQNLTAYDAWYVAAAEAFDIPLATLDRRLTRATGPRCRFLVPPG